MKVSTYITIITFLSSCFGKAPTINTGHEGKSLPSINLLLTDSSTQFNITDYGTGKAIVLFYFSPNCPYCRALTKKITESNKDLNEINFVMLSNFPLNDIKEYSKYYEIQKYPNITIGQDYETYFSKYFKAPGVPCLAIYGKDRLLKQVVMGASSINLIKGIALE